jgi:SulP family sulfate permease
LELLMSAASIGEGPSHALPSLPLTHHSKFEPWIPKSIVCLRGGFARRFFLHDVVAGLTVGVIAIPLALAFAIASHVAPERGLYTAIVAGFLVSLLGGSRVAIAGPTGAFVVIIAGVVDQFGYEGLALASLMAGVILLIMGAFKLGAVIKFIPYPVTTGFTSGIALIIFSQQMKEFFGLAVYKDRPIASDFVGQWTDYAWYLSHGRFGYAVTAVSLGSLAVLILLRRFAPRVPSYIVAVALATVVVGVFHLDERYGVATIQSRFGSAANPSGIPQKVPTISLPDLHKVSDASVPAAAVTVDGSRSVFTMIKRLIPAATTIALLAAIESLLCAVVADGMIGGRHKSNLELCAQGVANIASICFGGIPATGAIARTAANVKSGGRTPLAGIVHTITVLGVMLLLAPYAGKIPLAALAAVLVIVAWNMAERDHFRTLFKAPRSDIAVLLTTFGLTVFADLTIAVGVGMVLASMLFMKRMAEVTNVGAVGDEMEDQEDPEADPNSLSLRDVPAHTEVFEITGPFFFGVADRLKDTLRGLERPPKVFILRMRRVPAIDASGMHALDEFYLKCKRQGTLLLLAGVHAQPMFALAKYGLLDRVGEENMFGNVDDALNRAREIEGVAKQEKPVGAVAEVARER